MARQESSEIVQCLEDSRADFHSAADGLTELQATVSAAPGQWSVLQCVEHIVAAERRFLGWLQNPATDSAPAADKDREAMLLDRVSKRDIRVQAPEPVRPTGRFATLAEALKEFDSARGESILFAGSHGAHLYSLAAQHPFFGVCNGAEVMVLIAAHARRHAAQIRDIRSTL